MNYGLLKSIVIVARHVASGISPDAATADHRISSSDFLNADDILENRLPVQELIQAASRSFVFF
jgi:hypothetical protein